MGNWHIQKTLLVILAVAGLLVSVFVIKPYVCSETFRQPYEEALNGTQKTISKLTMAAAATSVAIAAVPDDSTTPIADQVANVASYLVVATIIVMFEKYLVGVSGYLVFTWLVPAICILLVLRAVTEYKPFQYLAAKIGIFSACIFLLVPISIRVSQSIDATYHTTQIINEVVEQEEDEAETVESEKKGLLQHASEIITGVADGIKDLPTQAQQMLSQFTEGVSVMLITSCGIPIVVFLLLYIVTKGIMNSFVTPRLDEKKLINELARQGILVRANSGVNEASGEGYE